jgi:hypothetical protein
MRAVGEDECDLALRQLNLSSRVQAAVYLAGRQG